MSRPFGLYFHVPFCDGKCPYCDFYSLSGTAELMDAYTARVESLLARFGAEWGRPVSTVYFGGGTPNLLGAGRLARLLEGAGKYFSISPGAEITCEANPTHAGRAFFSGLRRAGFNRVSMGLQSANEDELRLLGRAHTPGEAAEAVSNARAGGFDNLSLDLMLGLPHSGLDSLARSIQFAAGLEPEHISAYILKVEPDTPFASRQLDLPDGDEAAEQYLYCVRRLAELGYAQYEISNFSRPGRESRHNLLYWRDEEYLGLGPAAHSFYGGRRFFWPRDLRGFLAGGEPVDDGPGGSLEEYAMLNLRLTEGLSLTAIRERFGPQGGAAFREMQARAAQCPKHLIHMEPGRLRFTPEGFLVSNALLGRIID